MKYTFLLICGFFVIYMFSGYYIWKFIDKKTRYENINDEYLQIPMMLGSFFSLIFIKKIREKRKIYAIENKLNYFQYLVKYIGYDYLDEKEKQNYITYNRILKIKKVKKDIKWKRLKEMVK